VAPLAVDMNINGRLSAVLAFTSTGYLRASWRWTTSSQAPTVLRTGYATCCGRVEERDAVGNLVRSSQAYCSPHESPVGSRGIARTAMHASCLRRLRPVLICEVHSLETWPLNHAQPAASTPLLATSFCMEGEPGDADVNDHRVYPGHAVSRHLGGILPPPTCARPPYAWRGRGRLGHIRLTNVFDLPSIDVAAAPAAPTARAYAGCAGGCSHQSHISPAPNTSRAGIISDELTRDRGNPTTSVMQF